MKTRIMLVVKGGCLQRIVSDDANVEFFIFDKDHLEDGETNELGYKEEGWGVEKIGKNSFDNELTEERENWIEKTNENLK